MPPIPAAAAGSTRYTPPCTVSAAPFCASSACKAGSSWAREMGVAVRNVAVPRTAGSMV